MTNVVTIPAGARFLHILARELEKKFGDRLADALILLPTRRAVRELAEIMTGESGARILPRMRPLGDIDPDEPPFEPGYLTGLVKPQMPGAQRRFELAKLIGTMHKAKGEPLDPAAKLALVDPLLAILDDAAMEEVGLARMSELEEIKKMAALHFQEAATFYEILQNHWPKHLSTQNVMESFARRVALLNALTNLWGETPPAYPVIIAGSTGTLAANARLMGVVSEMPDGLIVLPGLDKNMPEGAWNDIRLKDVVVTDKRTGKAVKHPATPEHPQFPLKKLVTFLGVKHADVPTMGDELLGENPRLALISEALVPADATAGWPERIATLTQGAKNKNFFHEALDGLSIIETRTNDEEAMTIALIMRETVETANETAALVTPDPSLARRVKARLRRWNIDVDYTQGEPLEETSLGAFLMAILRLAENSQSPLEMAALFKHPLTGCGEGEGIARRHWRQLEKSHFRNDLDKARKALKDEKLIAWLSTLSPLVTNDALDGPEWARRLTQTAEALAAIPETLGAARLWREDAGEKASSLIEEILTYGGELGDMNLSQFSRLFAMLMRGKVVRPRYGTHPRLQILGPLEARMLTADMIILGGLNEGIWPQRSPNRPFLSRGMRKELGLSLPERRLGLAAHDFQQLASNPNVILTRAQRSDDGPRVASRWLWRLRTLVQGGLGDDADKVLAPPNPYHLWARNLNYVAPGDVAEPKRPAPKPPIAARWPKGRKLSVTKIRTWIRDPYAIYGQYVLGLKPLGSLTVTAGPREYGNALHKGIELFLKKYKQKLPSNAAEKLATTLKENFVTFGFDPIYLARETVRLDRVATDLIEILRERGLEQADDVISEIKDEMILSDVNFTLTGQPDLIEKVRGEYTIFDFKTGAIPTKAVVAAGFDPQMPLLASMVEAGAFKGVKPGPVVDLQYIRIKGAGDGQTKASTIIGEKQVDQYQADALHDLQSLVAQFDKEETAYHSQPRVQYKNDYGDYDLLARRAEWAKLGEGGTGHGD